MSGDLDIDVLLGTLVSHEVDFVLIGGLAAIAHGVRRLSFDVDVVVAPEEPNMRRLGGALEQLHVTRVVDEHFRDLDPLDDFDLARAGNLSLFTRAGRLDVVKTPAGMTTYDELRSGAVEVLVAGRPVPVVDKDRLVAMKLACGRPKDLMDVAQLTGREVDA